jgi:hypothetical protein
MRRFVIVLVAAVLSSPTASSAQSPTPHVQVGDSIRVLALGHGVRRWDRGACAGGEAQQRDGDGER